MRFVFTDIYDQRNVIKRKEVISHYSITAHLFCLLAMAVEFNAPSLCGRLACVELSHRKQQVQLVVAQYVASSLQICSLAIDSP